MSGLLPFPQKRTKLTVYDENDVVVWTKEIDVVISAQHDKEMIITDHPVSKGIPVTDNVKAKPRLLPLVAMFTDFPASPDEIVKKLIAAQSAQEVYDQLDEIMDQQSNGWRFKVETTRRTYENMLLQKMSSPVTVEKSMHVEVTLLFKEVRKASSKQSQISKPKRAEKQQKNNKGAQPKQKPPVERASTVAKKGLDKTIEFGKKALTKLGF